MALVVVAVVVLDFVCFCWRRLEETKSEAFLLVLLGKRGGVRMLLRLRASPLARRPDAADWAESDVRWDADRKQVLRLLASACLDDDDDEPD